jgi:indole-3-glycerol phosphate synthase
MTSILEKIAEQKFEEVEALKLDLPLEEILENLPSKGQLRFREALGEKSQVNIIAEIKKASPSKGIIRADFDPVDLARQYCEGGAAALSVLTETAYFFGRYEYLKLASDASGLPVLCKDFVVDPYQLYHAKYMGADAVLLIVRLLSRRRLADFLLLADEIGLDALVEVHGEEELEIACDSKAKIIGVNNRNLDTFEVDIETSVKLADKMPRDILKVAESGIFERKDVEKLSGAGYNCFLIGEALMKSDQPVELLKSLRGV